MTNMRRVTVSLPDELDRRILEMKKDDRFVRNSYSEVVRQMLEFGYKAYATERAQGSA